jgi:hypothetical protein
MTEETSNEKWIRISDNRAEKAEKALSLLAGNLATGYEYSPEQAQALVDRMMTSLNEVREAYGFPILAEPQADAAQDDAEVDEADEAEVEAAEDAEAPVAQAAAVATPATVSAAPFPNDEEDMILLRVGSRIDNAITMIEKGEPIEAKAILQAMMVA